MVRHCHPEFTCQPAGLSKDHHDIVEALPCCQPEQCQAELVEALSKAFEGKCPSTTRKIISFPMPFDCAQGDIRDVRQAHHLPPPIALMAMAPAGKLTTHETHPSPVTCHLSTSQKINLIFYSPRFYPLVGGLEKVVRVWADALTAMGHRVAVITDTAHPEPDQFSFPVYRDISFGRQWKLMRAADRVVQFNVSLKGLLVAKLSRRPLLISHHTALFYPGGRRSWQQQVKQWVSDHAVQGNICCSQYIASQFTKATVVYSPFEPGFFENQQLARAKNSLVYVGRLVSDKGVDLLLKAVRQLANKKIPCFLTIIGDGPERRALEKMAASGSIGDRITFTGSLPPKEIAGILNINEIMIVPSRMEPFGTTVLEGLACGCHMIVSNQGGLPEAGNGWVRYFENENVESLADALQQEIEKPALHEQTAIDEYLQQFSVEETARQFASQLEAVITG